MSLSFAAVANLTMGYGTLLMLGGVIGYVQKGSMMSLLAGLSFGLVIGINGLMVSHKSFVQPILFNLVLSAVLGVGMGVRAASLGKFMPAGMVSLIAVLMVAVYVKTLVSPPPKTKDT